MNELISAIHEKDELLDSQEDLLIKENKKHVKTKNAYAQEVEKNDKLTSELSICHDTISNLRICHTRVSGHQDPGTNIITRCAWTKSHTYDESWHRIECHIFTI
jgi:hypothetical protein